MWEVKDFCGGGVYRGGIIAFNIEPGMEAAAVVLVDMVVRSRPDKLSAAG